MFYNHQEIEKKWQQFWEDNQIFKAEKISDKPKYYVLDMFPYPSGAGLHVGHPLGYIASDIYARYKRHKGFNVLHPQGYDSFGLPAEQYAIQTGQHPAITTETNIATYRKQLDRVGFSFDWSREVRTSNPEYYKWTQWIFIQLFNSWYNNDTNKAEDISTLVEVFEKEGNLKVNAVCDEDVVEFSAEEWQSFDENKKQEILLQYRLTYLSDTEVNWCPKLGTVLANDEIVNGVSERGGHPVVRKKMTQWSMRISAYAQRLLDGLSTLDWTQALKDSQENWIGRSEGAMVSFPLSPEGEKDSKIEVLNTNESKKKFGYLTGGNNSAILIKYAQKMRDFPTDAEKILWEHLKSKKTGYKFRQQHLIGDFIADFVCLSKRLIIEIDGGYHDDVEQQVLDEERTAQLKVLGFEVVRFKNEEVIGDLDGVLHKISKILSTKMEVELDHDVTQNQSLFSPSGERGIEVFTTRPDTIFGVSFMTLAPEHELVAKITTEEQKAEVEAYIEATAKRSERDRMADVKTISGVFTGAYAIHPFTGEEIPIWIGDYVLASYGTGAVMAVPAGDDRDYAFAKHFNIPIKNIFDGVDISEQAYTDKSTKTPLMNSGFLDGLTVKKAMKTVIYEMEKQGIGYGKINYRLRDAVFSRQRYWGEPFPVYYKDGMPQMIDEKHLPIRLPEVEKYLPTEDGKPPLGNAEVWAWDTDKNEVVSNDKINNMTIFPLELNTMPGWAGSSWYFNRYMDAGNAEEFASKEALNYWKEVDLYIGGSEHATGHLLYARFWQKFLFDKGLVPTDEFAKKLINQGMILGTSAFVYREEGTNKFHSKGLIEGKKMQPIHAHVSFVGAGDVLDVEKFKAWREDFKDAEFILEDGKYIVGREVEKMSKSKYNVVNPDDICEEYGADCLRLYEMFLGPLEQSKPWNTQGLSGVYGFLKKFYNLYFNGDNFEVSEEEPTKEEYKILHTLIKKFNEDVENFSFNTSVSSFMIAVNELQKKKCNKRAILEPLAVIISPYAPHICEELWQNLGHTTSIEYQAFPEFEEKHLVESTKTYPISFNGKMRFTLDLPMDMPKDEIEKMVMADERTQKQLAGREPKKVIIVPGKIVNIVG
ncbi:MAG: leucine--tRNA ligase [Flavobacteriales bacterium]|nr:MAG: leucine--tRNA ligase [Flavobacteriales bacterium]